MHVGQTLWDRVSRSFPGWPWTFYPPISAFPVARITGPSNQAWPFALFLNWLKSTSSGFWIILLSFPPFILSLFSPSLFSSYTCICNIDEMSSLSSQNNVVTETQKNQPGVHMCTLHTYIYAYMYMCLCYKGQMHYFNVYHCCLFHKGKTRKYNQYRIKSLHLLQPWHVISSIGVGLETEPGSIYRALTSVYSKCIKMDDFIMCVHSCTHTCTCVSMHVIMWIFLPGATSCGHSPSIKKKKKKSQCSPG